MHEILVLCASVLTPEYLPSSAILHGGLDFSYKVHSSGVGVRQLQKIEIAFSIYHLDKAWLVDPAHTLCQVSVGDVPQGNRVPMK